jgi:hypothetical protein
MANLKDIRDRIGSVKNTRKITEAMRLVAAAKVRRAQEQVLRSRPFADRLARVLENLQSRMRFEDADAPLLEQREVGTITLLAVTGDRGLCGGYNANIIKRTELRTAELVGQGYKVDLVLIGRKAITYFQNRANQYTIRATFTGLDQVPKASEAMGIANEVLAVDLETRVVSAHIPAGREPVASALSPDGKTLAVANLLPAGRADGPPAVRRKGVRGVPCARACAQERAHARVRARECVCACVCVCVRVRVCA